MGFRDFSLLVVAVSLVGCSGGPAADQRHVASASRDEVGHRAEQPTSRSRSAATRGTAGHVAITAPTACDWTHVGGDHARSGCVEATDLHAKLATISVDPFVDAEIISAAAFGFGTGILSRYAAVLTAGDDFYVVYRSGTYVNCNDVGPVDPCGPDTWDQLQWSIRAYHWASGVASLSWETPVSWFAEPDSLTAGPWEPLLQPAIVGAYLYAPEGNGQVSKIDRATGTKLATFASPGPTDSSTLVSGGIETATDGSIYYNVVALDPAVATRNPRGAWLVKVTSAGTELSAPFTSLIPSFPGSTALCSFPFFTAAAPPAFPWPPSTTSTPPQKACGVLRPALNIAPIVSADGSMVYDVGRSRANTFYSYIFAARTKDLAPVWDRSLRDILHDDCGVTRPSTAAVTDVDDDVNCRVGSLPGIAWATNQAPAGQASDLSSSTLSLAPDGHVLYGAFTDYDDDRGHLMSFDGTTGASIGMFPFGWDGQAAIRKHGSTYSIIMSDDHYAKGEFDVVSLAPDLSVEWSVRLPGANEFVSRNAYVDHAGATHLTANDGALWSVSAAGVLVDHTQLGTDGVTSNSIPVSVDAAGRVYTFHAGQLIVLGASGTSPSP